MSQELINKYRPRQFSEVLGQTVAARSLQANIEGEKSRTFLLSGPSGCGKTSLARLGATAAGCQAADLIEVDAAKNTGIEDMRAVAASLFYRPLGEGAVKALILDECHALSKSAVQSLLKVLEEPPPWAYWFLCTTEPTRIPEAIRTRCVHLTLKPVPTDDLIALLDRVAAAEKLFDGPQGEQTIDLCAAEANGSPRQALSNLAACIGTKTLKEAQELLRSASSSEEAVNLARALVQRRPWSEVQKILNGLQETNPESVRHVVRAYVSTVILKAKSEAQAGSGLEILSLFSEPFHSADGISPLVLACGRIVLG